MAKWCTFCVALFLTSIASAQDQDARIKIGPQPKYPMIASWLRIEGYCEVRFMVNERGFVVAPSASCTRAIFCHEAKRAVTASRFSPKLVGGVPVKRRNVVFPLNFFFEGSGDTSKSDPRPLEPCEEIPVS